MSETGHAKNAANFETVILALVALGAAYNPTQPLILLTALQNRLAATKAAMMAAASTATTKTLAVDARENAYRGIGKFSTALEKAVAVSVNDAAFTADLRTLTRQIKGERAGEKPVENPATPAVDESKNAHSVSHRSYNNIESNFGKVINLLEARPEYTTNEPEFQIAALKTRHALMQATNTAAKTAEIAADNDREIRDTLLYNDETGVLALIGLIKKYLDYAFGKDSAVYQQVNALKFKKVH